MIRTLLMSFDLEDARLFSEDGTQYPSRVVNNTLKFLDFLKLHKLPCTFFTVGHIFENHPDLIREIIHQGHELAWHSDKHLPVTQSTQTEFEKDLEKAHFFSDTFKTTMIGYRAPTFSVNESTSWLHEALNKHNFKYSSSVLPAKNPLYGWESFGEKPRIVHSILEIPVTLLDYTLLKIPLGGTYLRSLPFDILKFGIDKKNTSAAAITIYLHPYDLDPDQERYFHGGINKSRFYNWLMYYNRKSTLPKIEKIINLKGLQILSYKQYYEQFSSPN